MNQKKKNKVNEDEVMILTIVPVLLLEPKVIADVSQVSPFSRLRMEYLLQEGQGQVVQAAKDASLELVVPPLEVGHLIRTWSVPG